ncbi:MAG: LPS export ABC transporter ATP-binding protein [bacterium]
MKGNSQTATAGIRTEGKPEIAERGLVARSLKKTYHGRKVVDGVGFSVRPGEVAGLLGPNGAGKTTSFYMVVGVIQPDGGEVFLEGREIVDLPMYKRAARGINYLPQEASIFRGLSVEDNLMAVAEHMALSKRERKERVDMLLRELGVEHIRKNKAVTLSGGERRRVEIARSLVTEPRIILMDEPFAGIDPIAVSDIQRIVNNLSERGIGVLITDHNVRETLSICDHATIIHEGAVIISGTPADIVENPLARKHYLGEDFELVSSKRAPGNKHSSSQGPQQKEDL